MTFTRVDREMDDVAESTAVAEVIERTISGQPIRYNANADRAFRRWLGKSRKTDVDMSVRIDGTIERIILSIKAPSPGSHDLRLQILRPKKPSS